MWQMECQAERNNTNLSDTRVGIISAIMSKMLPIIVQITIFWCWVCSPEEEEMVMNFVDPRQVKFMWFKGRLYFYKLMWIDG